MIRFASSMLAVVVVWFAGCSPSAAFCAKSAECADAPDDEDGNVGDEADDQAICTETQDGLLKGLRANSEAECRQLADAIDARNACEGALSCDDFNADDENGKCDDEKDQLADACDAIADAEANCESFLSLLCGFGG